MAPPGAPSHRWRSARKVQPMARPTRPQGPGPRAASRLRRWASPGGISASATSSTRPLALQMGALPAPRIDPSVREIDQKIGHHEDQDDHENPALNDRVVAGADGLIDQR